MDDRTVGIDGIKAVVDLPQRTDLTFMQGNFDNVGEIGTADSGGFYPRKLFKVGFDLPYIKVENIVAAAGVDNVVDFFNCGFIAAENQNVVNRETEVRGDAVKVVGQRIELLGHQIVFDNNDSHCGKAKQNEQQEVADQAVRPEPGQVDFFAGSCRCGRRSGCYCCDNHGYFSIPSRLISHSRVIQVSCFTF